MQTVHTKPIDFSYNWNNKLQCKQFTTIRLWNPHKYKIGHCYEIKLKGQPNGYGRIHDMKPVLLANFNEWHARIDTGYSLKEMLNIINRMYKGKVADIHTQKFAFILIERVEPQQAKLL